MKTLKWYHKLWNDENYEIWDAISYHDIKMFHKDDMNNFANYVFNFYFFHTLNNIASYETLC